MSGLLYIVPLVLAGLLLWVRGVPISWLNARFIPSAQWEFWVDAAMVAMCLLSTVWARTRLGENWSCIAMVKQDHELITGGPYAFVRHPICAALLLAFVGSALALGEWRGIVAVVIAFFSLWHKLQLEERWMFEQFGEDYTTYSERVPALIPFLI